MRNTSAQSLSSRLTRSLLWAIGGVWFAVVIGSAWYARTELDEGMDNTLVHTSHRLLDLALHDVTLSAATPAGLSPPLPPQVQRGDASFKEDNLVYQVVDASRRVLLRSREAPAQPLQVPLTNGFTDIPGWRVYTYQHPEQPVFIHLADSAGHRQEAQWETTLWLLLPMLGVLPLLGLLIRFITHRGLAPVRQLALQISQRSGQNLSRVCGVALPAELQIISDSTNHLLQRLSDALDIERALAANAAHELRTPLATTQLHLHAMLNLPLTDAARAEAGKALASLVQLNRRAEKLLQMSRAESAAALNSAPVNLGLLAAAIAQEFWADPRLLDTLHLHTPLDKDVMALGDFDALAILLRNLVENAVRHGKGSDIDIVVEPPAVLRVRDQGPGVVPEKISQIRQRHIKSADSGAGYGLGMSIISTIVQRQGGTLSLASPPAGHATGFEVVVCLPPALLSAGVSS